MKAFFRHRAVIQAISGALAETIDDLVSAHNTPPFDSAPIKFPTVPLPSLDASTLDDYREGAWTPADASGASLALTQVLPGTYVKIGRLVILFGILTYPATASGADATWIGLPYVISAMPGGGIAWLNTSGVALTLQTAFISNGLSSVIMRNPLTGAKITNVQLTGATIGFVVFYLSAT